VLQSLPDGPPASVALPAGAQLAQQQPKAERPRPAGWAAQ
jgi:hypothetical protein